MIWYVVAPKPFYHGILQEIFENGHEIILENCPLIKKSLITWSFPMDPIIAW